MTRNARVWFGLASTMLVLALVFTPAYAATYTVTVTGTINGPTEQSIGAVEACSRFNIADLTDLGITNFRIYGGMSRLEPNDDDGVFGSPTIAEIKANPNVVNWAAWDQQFNRPDAYFWTGADCLGHGTTSLKDMLAQMKANGIHAVFTLRNVDNGDNPAWAQQLNPPNTPEGQNEWWEHVFATVYWLNVTNGLDVHDWEVHNEPDNAGQGWGGTQADYLAFTQLTHDAIKYVYDTYLPGKTFRLYAPVSTHANDWITASLQQNDAIVDVVDWHRYGPPADEAATINGWIDQYDTDGVHEPLYLSEWGSYRGAYSSVGDALNYASQLRDHNIPGSYVASSAIFSLYDWSTRVTGLMAPDGTKREPFYALRLMIRGLNGAKNQYNVTSNIPANTSIFPVAAKDPATGTLWVEIINKMNTNQTITLDLSAHATTGTVTFRQYSASVKDAVTGTGTLSNGRVTFTLPKSAIVQVSKP